MQYDHTAFSSLRLQDREKNKQDQVTITVPELDSTLNKKHPEWPTEGLIPTDTQKGPVPSSYQSGIMAAKTGDTPATGR